ncbi:MAG TPA: hypothetical protein VEY07_07165 [Thermoplasmata archaeon]|nr:hypothetical protein [Thermoplasmata archaeon]
MNTGPERHTPSWAARARPYAGPLVASVVLVVITVLGNSGPGSLTSHSGPGAIRIAAAGSVGTLSAAPGASSGLTLGITTTPAAICVYTVQSCSAGVDEARVTLAANAGGTGQISWPAVQVAFVVETTLFDGVFDPSSSGDEPGHDPCANPAGSNNVACEESNGVPFFVANSQQIASAIQAANPHTQVSFALVDYFATLKTNDWDDGDGAEYHVDIPQFIQASDFGAAVQSTFKQEVLHGSYFYSDSDFSDNFLHSSSITALYGTIVGSGLDWSNNTHHVIVWLGSTAPRDPSYPVDYCVSGAVQAANPTFEDGCIAQTWEPSYRYSQTVSPNAEGWIKASDGNATHSIAALAHTAKQCTESVGGVCTIDMIDYWDTPTDPYSLGWPKQFSSVGGGPGGLAVLLNSAHIIEAGCDMAAATGGTWDGPAFASCPDGQQGSLQYVPHGSYNNPNTANPTLFNALRQIGFGPVTETQVAAGTGKPIFTFVPIGSITLAPDLQPTAACQRAGEPFRTCQMTPTIQTEGQLTYLGWNWSTNKSQNIMYVGDSWTASFNIISTGPPFTLVPVDACVTTDCKASGSGAVNGYYSAASYWPASNTTIVTESFPLSKVRVQGPPSVLQGTAPPPPPPVPPPFAIPTAPPLPVVQQIGVGNSVGVANVSLQAAAAGFLGAGFMRVTIRNRPIAMRVAAKSGSFQSKFDAESMKQGSSIGRFE